MARIQRELRNYSDITSPGTEQTSETAGSTSSEREEIDKESTGNSEEENYWKNNRKERDTKSDAGISYTVMRCEPLKVKLHRKKEIENLGTGFKTSDLESKIKKDQIKPDGITTPYNRCKKKQNKEEKRNGRDVIWR